METKQPPQPVPGDKEREKVEKPALPTPEGEPSSAWAEKAERAREARELGRRLRKGKRVLFPSRRSMNH